MGAPIIQPAALSFAAIYEAHFEFVWAVARRLGVKTEALEDLVQEVFNVVHRKLHTLEGPNVVRDWLYGIVRRKVSTLRKKDRALQHVTASALENLSATDDPMATATLERRVDARQMLSLIECIDPKKREVLMMAKVDELTCPQIAEVLNIPVTTAYARLRNGKAELATVATPGRTGFGGGDGSRGREVAKFVQDARMALKPSRFDKARVRAALMARMSEQSIR